MVELVLAFHFLLALLQRGLSRRFRLSPVQSFIPWVFLLDSGGYNRCYYRCMMEPEELIGSLSQLPSDSLNVETEIFIADWIERNDDVNESDASSFNYEDKWFAILEASVNEVSSSKSSSFGSSTRLGGIAHWFQFPPEAPNGWEFVGQIDSTYSFIEPPM